MNTIQASFFAILFFCSSLASACSGQGTVIYYGNGMFNSMNDVQNSLVELKRLDVNTLESRPNQIQYSAALNLSESDLDNILTAIHQKVEGDLSYFWNVLDGIIPFPDWLTEPVQKALLSNVDSSTLNAMLSQYQSSLQAQMKVVLVSHSQGNFYAEEAAKQMVIDYAKNNTHDFGFGNVRVATFIHTEFSYPYFNFKDDFFVNLMRLISSVPSANLFSLGAGPGPELDPNGHNFVDAYLANPESREKIRQAILSEAKLMDYPCGL